MIEDFAKAERRFREKFKCKDCTYVEQHLLESHSGCLTNCYLFCAKEGLKVSGDEMPCKVFKYHGNIVYRNGRWQLLSLPANDRTLRTEEYLRPEVLWFATVMEEKLRENDYRGGWEECSFRYLFQRLGQETKELKDSLDIPVPDADDVVQEAADVANFVLMIADNARRVKKWRRGKQRS